MKKEKADRFGKTEKKEEGLEKRKRSKREEMEREKVKRPGAVAEQMES